VEAERRGLPRARVVAPTHETRLDPVSNGPSLYRRHRPRTFADVVGQEHVVRTLSHAVERGQVHHAYLFVGSRGTGKTSMAKILAACLNCENGPTITPCGVCDSCMSIANATSLDVIEMDAASNNSVDDIRELREKVAYAPVSGRHKVYILDEAHMLSSQAWNAFLKTLEEPPPRTVFVLATTEAQRVLPTVADRCHRFDFGRPTAEQVASVVRRVATAESIQIDDGSAALVARHATGSFRDALGTLEQLVTYAGDEPIQPEDVLAVLGIADAEQLFASVDAVIARDPAAALRAATALSASGRDPGQVLRDLEIHGRELLSVQVLGEVPPEVRVTADRDSRLLDQAQRLAPTDAVRLLELVSGALEATANGSHPHIQLELVLIRAAAPQFDPSVGALLARIERLEQGGVGSVTPEPPNAGAVEREQPEASASASADQDRVEAVASSNGAAGAVAETAVAPDPEPVTAPAPEGAHAGADAAPASPPVATPISEGTLTVEQVASMWPAVVELVRGANAMLASLLAGARPIALSDGEVMLAFPANAAFMKRKVESDEHRRATAEALRNVIGMSLMPRYELADTDELPEMTVPVVAVKMLTGDELVRRFVEELGAEEIFENDQESAS
jgi:DNA polymerase-3 subunit gamma/tau